MKIFGHSSKFSFRSRISVLVIGMILAVVSLVYTNKLANVLKQKEQHDVELWVAAMERVSPECRHNLWHALLKEGKLVEE